MVSPVGSSYVQQTPVRVYMSVFSVFWQVPARPRPTVSFSFKFDFPTGMALGFIRYPALILELLYCCRLLTLEVLYDCRNDITKRTRLPAFFRRSRKWNPRKLKRKKCSLLNICNRNLLIYTICWLLYEIRGKKINLLFPTISSHGMSLPKLRKTWNKNKLWLAIQ